MRFEGLDLNLLVAFNTLIETRSVTEAAQRIHLSQSGMTGALNRLRDYFQDDLLVVVGRKMMLTPKAELLVGPVRDTLRLIKITVTTPRDFIPATSERKFQLVASDYAYAVLIAGALRTAAQEAPNVSFDIAMPSHHAAARLESGELDLMITLDHYMTDLTAAFPKRHLLEDEHVVVCCQNNEFCGDMISVEDYFGLRHVIVLFGPERNPAFSETVIEKLPWRRRVAARVPVFSDIPQTLIGTNLIATMYRRHAELLARTLPIKVLPMPFVLPTISEVALWHPLRERDGGLCWLLDHLGAAAASLPRQPNDHGKMRATGEVALSSATLATPPLGRGCPVRCQELRDALGPPI
jgi:LysR family transcriptional regulator, nod-box dependent transcriptional activator